MDSFSAILLSLPSVSITNDKRTERNGSTSSLDAYNRAANDLYALTVDACVKCYRRYARRRSPSKTADDETTTTTTNDSESVWSQRLETETRRDVTAIIDTLRHEAPLRYTGATPPPDDLDSYRGWWRATERTTRWIMNECWLCRSIVRSSNGSITSFENWMYDRGELTKKRMANIVTEFCDKDGRLETGSATLTRDVIKEVRPAPRRW